ncbi:phenylacetate--CoA ligase family protein [Armatimonas sp.]|uniref:phenylacetate--CoA ligase family protein n=1 Tax=Armatimonas sp. TaxID=1872638 RepID=UPI00374DDE75
MSFPSRAALEAEQLAQLNILIAALMPSNAFYAPKLDAVGLGQGVGSLVEFFARMPLTTKQQIVDDQREHGPYGTNLTYPLERYTRFCQTSGTSGFTLRWLDTTESWEWMVENWVEVFRAAEVAARDRLFYAFSFGPFLGFWTAFAAGERLGCLCLPGGGMSSAARLKTILDNRVTTLCCTPTYAIRLGEVALEEGIELATSAVRRIIVAGEPGAGIPATRARIEQLWPGARLWDHHGMTETGPVSFECPVRPGVLHVLESRFIAEVLDPENLHTTPPGGRGELVLTNLGRTGSPLLRYRTGDLVLRGDDTVCACGRSDLALEGGILGRTDDMVVVRGVNLYPSAIEAVVRRFQDVAEYRVTLTTVNALREALLELEPLPTCSDSEALRLAVESALRATFHLRLPTSVVGCGTLPRSEMKAQRWVRTET